jgi:uncharacterized Fe-S radical SAM superfamily protein PflX
MDISEEATISDLAELGIWSDPAIRGALSWYLDVAENRRPAKFRIAGTIFFTSCNMRCAFCQNGDISTDKDNGEETDPRTLAAMAWTLRREGCHNINWVGGEVVIHLHAIVDAIALLGRDFSPIATRVDARAQDQG